MDTEFFEGRLSGKIMVQKKANLEQVVKKVGLVQKKKKG